VRDDQQRPALADEIPQQGAELGAALLVEPAVVHPSGERAGFTAGRGDRDALGSPPDSSRGSAENAVLEAERLQEFVRMPFRLVAADAVRMHRRQQTFRSADRCSNKQWNWKTGRFAPQRAQVSPCRDRPRSGTRRRRDAPSWKAFEPAIARRWSFWPEPDGP